MNNLEAVRKTLGVVREELNREKKYRKEAEKALKQRQSKEDTAASIRKLLYGLSDIKPRPPKWVGGNGKSVGSVSVPVAVWSDWHAGEVVRPSEVGGLNTFNMNICEERIDLLVNRTVEIAMKHMGGGYIKYPGIVVCLGGDMISGGIHEELRETNDGTIQQTLLRLQDKLAGALTHMADNFGNVFVPCVVGNHGRMKHKPHAKHRAFENYEWSLYQQLERYFKDDDRVKFYIPDGPDAFFNVLGHRFLLTHGDSLGVKGGDGIIGAIGPIARGAVKVGRSEGQVGRDFDTLLLGHWHIYIPRGEASPVAVNGTLKGFDEFAHTFLRVPYSRPSQSLMFVNAKHGITAQWQVFLEGKRKVAPQKDWVAFSDL